MIACGVEIKGSDAVVVILEGTKENFKIINTDIKKIPLLDNEDHLSVKSFFDNFKDFVLENNIGSIGIKKRNTKGKFAGGSVSFKIEALIQLVSVPSKLIPGPTITKNMKKSNVTAPEYLLKYQSGAFETCYSLFC